MHVRCDGLTHSVYLFRVSSLKMILGRRYRDPFLRSFATSVQYPIVDHFNKSHVRLDYKSKDGKDTTLVVSETLCPFSVMHSNQGKI
jgi:hypothetical protein